MIMRPVSDNNYEDYYASQVDDQYGYYYRM